MRLAFPCKSVNAARAITFLSPTLHSEHRFHSCCSTFLEVVFPLSHWSKTVKSTLAQYTMPPFRLPFTSKKPVTNEVIQGVPDENAKPEPLGSPYKPSLALGQKEKRQDVNEFKLSCMWLQRRPDANH